MIYQIYLGLVVFGIIFIIVGIFSKILILEMFGYMTLFLMGIVLFSTGIEYQSGETIEQNYYYDNTTLVNSDSLVLHTYNTYTNWFIGFYMSVISALCFAFSWFHYKAQKDFGG